MAPTSTYLAGHGSRTTPQSEPIPGTNQVVNSAGGFSFEVDDWARLERWLILGSAGGSYYAGQRQLTGDNVDVVRRCLDAAPERALSTIEGVSRDGRAPSNTEAIYALALAAGHESVTVRQMALDLLPLVCRTGTHLYEFVGFVEQHRGWGRSLRRAVAAWYEERDIDSLAYQLVKYRQREGWRHRDTLGLAHPSAAGDPARSMLYEFVRTGEPKLVKRRVVDHFKTKSDKTVPIYAYEEVSTDIEPPAAIQGYLAAQAAKTPKDTVKAIEQFGGALPREALLTEHLKDADVNAALLDAGMPMTALIRNLGNLTRYGVLKPLSEGTRSVVAQLADVDAIRKARVHPMAVLMALRTYQAGQGFRGTNTWAPVQAVVDALDAAFYLAFDNVEPTGKRHVLGLDVSGSMDSPIRDSNLTCMEAALAMAMVTDKVEPWTAVRGFDHGFVDLNVSHRMRLDAALGQLPRNYGGTDCALPMVWAAKEGIEVDVFVVLTDSETRVGRVHPVQALRHYREKTGIAAKLVVVGMVASPFTIADPNDAGMLDVVGFDTATPAAIASFVR